MTQIENYVNVIRIILQSEGLERANETNHLALERKEINLEMFQAAARVLAKEILKR